MNLNQQLEDKKKEKEKLEEYYIYPYHMEQDKEALEKYNKLCFEIAILEQAIAEMQKQRQEILDILERHVQNHMNESYNYHIFDDLKQQLNQPKTEQ